MMSDIAAGFGKRLTVALLSGRLQFYHESLKVRWLDLNSNDLGLNMPGTFICTLKKTHHLCYFLLFPSR